MLYTEILLSILFFTCNDACSCRYDPGDWENNTTDAHHSGGALSFRVAWLKITLPMFGNMKWIFLVYPLSWALGAAMMALYTWKGNWRPYRKEQ